VRDMVQKAKGGDLEAFGALVDHYRDMVYGASYAVLGNFHDAQDTAQEAFVQAWQKLNALKDCGAFPGWLYRITRNLSLDRARRSRESTESIDDVARTVPDPENKGPRQCAEQQELHESVLDAIRSLSEPNRLATTLFYINGYSIEEVAEFLEVPSGTVKRRLHDSRAQLQERMVEMVEETLKSNPLPEEFARGTLQKIGDFACLGLIGTGGLGSVFKCEHPVLKHKVAIKIAAFRQPDMRGTFRRGYETLNKLDHPGFVKTFSCGEHEGRPYMVSELLEGQNLKGWLNDHGPREFWRILYKLLGTGMTIFLSTAYLDEAERAHRVGLLDQGTLLAVDSPAALLRHAMNFEKDSILFLHEMRPLVREEARRMVDRLLDEERKHLRLLTDSLEKLGGG